MSRRALRRAGWIALAVASVLCFAGVFQHGLWTPDEPREAEIAREMLESGFSAVPTLGGEPFLEKPPLLAWITAASFAVFGVSPGAARVPSTLFSVGAVMAAYLLGKRAAGRAAGLCSAIALATMWQFSETSHKAVLDTGLAFFVAAGHLAFIRCQERSVGRAVADGSFLAPYLAIGVLSGLAFLTKAWIGPALLCAPPILAWAAMREWGTVRRVLPRAFAAATLGVAVLGVPWVLAVADAPNGGWAAVKESLWTEYVGRSVGGAEFRKQGHANPPWYYLHTVPYVVLPWLLALPAILKGGTLARSWRRGGALWCGLVFVAGVVLLSIPSGKRDLYLVPLLPAAAVVPGVWLSRVGSRRGGAWDGGTGAVLFWLMYAVGVVVAMLLGYAAFTTLGRPDLDGSFDGAGPLLGAWLAVGTVATIVAVEAARRRPHLPGRLAAVSVALFASLGLFARPALDPARDMSAGSREVAALVPESEEFLSFDADETTLAVVPFHSGRMLSNTEDAGEVEARLRAGRSRHVVIMEKDLRKLSPALRRSLDLVKKVRLSATRDVSVYAYEP